MRAEHERGATGSFEPDLPRISDGDLLFLLHMFARMKPAIEGSSPLPAGEDPGDGEGVPRNGREFFEREVKAHVPNAWIDTNKRDEREDKVGVVDCEIKLNCYFYRYTPPRPLEDIETDIRVIEQDSVRMLAEVTGTSSGSEPHPERSLLYKTSALAYECRRFVQLGV